MVANQLFVKVTRNLPLHMVTLKALLMYVQLTMICVQMAWEHIAEAILWAQGAPQQLATTSMAPPGAILLVRHELVVSRSLC